MLLENPCKCFISSTADFAFASYWMRKILRKQFVHHICEKFTAFRPKISILKL